MDFTATGKPGRARKTAVRLAAGLSDVLARERDRWILWLPVALGIGVGVYFALPFEPPVLAGQAVLALCAGGIALFWRNWTVRLVLAGLLAAALGFVVAQWRTHDVAAPVLERALPGASVKGRVVSVEPGVRGPRVILDVTAISRIAAADLPQRVRLRLHKEDRDIRPGDLIRVRARIAPPPSASYPGAFDFSRRAWFEQLGGVGFAFGAAERLGRHGEDGWLSGLQRAVEGARTAIAARISEDIGGPAGGVAAALATGLRGEIPEDVRQDMRDSGLAHLLAISGLHIGLVAGFVFALVRGGLALAPRIALRWPLKQIAAVTALLAAAVYMLLAGATVPTQRAFVMTAVVLLAVLVNRTGISLRMIALAASVVLLLRPEALLGVSFQMSFAAAIALVAAYEAFAGRFRVSTGEAGTARRITMYFAAVAFTTLVASLATAPFAVFHFNRLAVLGLTANLAAVPIAALWVMPLEVVTLLLMPLGLEQVALVPLGWGVEVILAVAAEVASWPLAAITVPGTTTIGLVIMAAGGLWLALSRTRWRLAGIAAILAGLATTGQATPPDILIADEARLTAFRAGPDELRLSSLRSQAFVRDIWLRRAGEEEGTAFPPPGEGSAVLRCDGQSCIGRIDGRTVAFVTDPLAFEEDCRIADVVVAQVPAPRDCDHPDVVIDWFDLWRDGAHAILLDSAGGNRVWQARTEHPARPWMRRSNR